MRTLSSLQPTATGRANSSNSKKITLDIPTPKQGLKDVTGVIIGASLGSLFGPVVGAIAGYKLAQKEWKSPLNVSLNK